MGKIGMAGIGLNRKMLAELAVNEPQAFAALADVAKQSLSQAG